MASVFASLHSTNKEARRVDGQIDSNSNTSHEKKLRARNSVGDLCGIMAGGAIAYASFVPLSSRRKLARTA